LISNYLREGGYILPGICLSVCLSVCLLATSHKNCLSGLHQNSTKECVFGQGRAEDAIEFWKLSAFGSSRSEN